MSHVVLRALSAWTDPVTAEPQYHRFDASWAQTIYLLRREADMLSVDGFGDEVTVQVQTAAGNERKVGMGLRADSKITGHGVVVSFDSRHGPLRYACDTFVGGGYARTLLPWQANVRAIALGLEALRKVDRYGIAQSGEQYRGFAQLGSGIPMGPATMTLAAAREILCRYEHHPGEYSAFGVWDKAIVTTLYKRAARIVHPDKGGDPEEFKRVAAARDFLDEYYGKGTFDL